MRTRSVFSIWIWTELCTGLITEKMLRRNTCLAPIMLKGRMTADIII